MKSFKIILMILAIVMYLTNVGLAQTDTAYIEKKECISEGIYRGHKLIVHYRQDTINAIAKMYDYNLDFLNGVSDKIKLDLIRMLLNYQDDTTMCCIKVQHYNFNGNEGCRGNIENVSRYTIQVDALFMINRLCWPKLIELYSCSPVLYDNKLKKEINSDPEKIKCVFRDYKKWFEDCKAKGKIDKYFPFNTGRYVWDGGRKSVSPKE
jgi:hypothetical protein